MDNRSPSMCAWRQVSMKNVQFTSSEPDEYLRVGLKKFLFLIFNPNPIRTLLPLSLATSLNWTMLWDFQYDLKLKIELNTKTDSIYCLSWNVMWLSQKFTEFNKVEFQSRKLIFESKKKQLETSINKKV